MRDHRELGALARRQLGLVHRDEIRTIGYSDQDLWRMRDSGFVEPLRPAVFRLGGAPLSRRQTVFAAVLDGGNDAAASHATAAALWVLPGHELLRLADAAQTERLERAGYFVARVTETQVWMRPHEVATTAHRARLRRLPRSDHAATAAL
jgi:hypothetical protein